MKATPCGFMDASFDTVGSKPLLLVEDKCLAQSKQY